MILKLFRTIFRSSYRIYYNCIQNYMHNSSAMLNALKALCLLFVGFILPGCFEVVEEISMNADGSGEITITINASQSRAKLKSVMLMDSINGRKVPSREEISREILTAKNKLNSLDGISQVQTTINHDQFTYSITARFANVTALNKAINYLAETSIKDRNLPVNYKQFDNYSYQSGTFKRLEPAGDRAAQYNKASKADKEVIEDANYTCVYKFPWEIKSVSNPKALISKSKKNVMLRMNMKELASGKGHIRNTIQLR